MTDSQWAKIRTLPLAKRKNKVSIEDFCPWPRHGQDLLDRLPDILIGSQWREFIELYVTALRRKRTIVLMLGGHVVKTGLSPLLISLMRQGAVSHLAMNGAAAIHDYEIALIGATSEDVAEYLEDGRFGLWTETGAMNTIINAAQADPAQPGFGAAMGQAVAQGKFPHKRYSILAAAWELGIPLTVHAAIGAEIIHQHPNCSGAAIGETSFRDFRRLAQTVGTLHRGIVMNWGSAVILPEVFLKALAVARNLGKPAYEFTSATFDMLRQYRPLVNVVERPTGKSNRQSAGSGFVFTGHHEILFPLLYHSLERSMPPAKAAPVRKKSPGKRTRPASSPSAPAARKKA